MQTPEKNQNDKQRLKIVNLWDQDENSIRIHQ